MTKPSPREPAQLSFLDAATGNSGTGEVSFAWGQRMRALMAAAIKRSRLSRQQIAERMSAALNEPISLHQLNAWLADSKAGHRFPAEYLPAFCAATGDHDLVRDIAQMLGGQMATREELTLAELGRLYRRRREASKREKALLDLLENREP